MRIDVISRREDLDRLKQNWDKLYRADPDAQYFLSWQFISALFRYFEGQWFVLAASQGARSSHYVALMPLRLKTRMNVKAGIFYHDVHMGGSYFADYTGAVCAPEFARAAMAAFAKHLRRMHWANLHLDNLYMSSGRLRSFLENLEDKQLTMRTLSRINAEDNVDNAKCPSVDLPETWDAYLEQKLGTNMRQKLRRFLRKVDGSEEFRITLADSATIKRDVGILLDFWKNRWGPRKGNRLSAILDTNRNVFSDAFADGSLFLPVLWHRDRPLGALATFIDPVKKTYLFCMAGRDESAEIVPPGLVLHAYSIRHAIANGYRTYDFLRGDEAYKYTFGASDKLITCKVVQTRTRRNLGDRLDPSTLSGIFHEANKNHQKGHTAEAENAYRQILDTDPAHAQTLYAIGQLLADKGDHRAAAAAFGKLLVVVPHLAKGWVRLGNALQALDNHADAADAFRKALEIQPDIQSARDGLGISMVKLGQTGIATTTPRPGCDVRLKAPPLLGEAKPPTLPLVVGRRQPADVAPTSLKQSVAIIDPVHYNSGVLPPYPPNRRAGPTFTPPPGRFLPPPLTGGSISDEG